MKKIFLGLALLCSAALVNAQNGLEALTVEKYYVSNATDAALGGAITITATVSQAGSVNFKLGGSSIGGCCSSLDF